MGRKVGRRSLTPEPSGRHSCAMGRRRVADLQLPEDVHCVKSPGREYFYYQRGRGKKDPAQRGPRTKVHGSPRLAAGPQANLIFWAEYHRIKAASVSYPAGSIGELVRLYREDDAYLKLAARTRTVYDIHLDRIARPEAWGFLKVNDLTSFAVKTGRDALKATPGMANQLLGVGGTLYR